jgi:hypothetical protein
MQESNLVVRCTPEAGARAGGERLPLWSAALMRRNFLLSRVNADGKQTGETNTEGETPMRFFSSPLEFRLPGRTICSSLRLENSVCQAEQSCKKCSEPKIMSGPFQKQNHIHSK